VCVIYRLTEKFVFKEASKEMKITFSATAVCDFSFFVFRFLKTREEVEFSSS
jgi:hypothetical protein